MYGQGAAEALPAAQKTETRPRSFPKHIKRIRPMLVRNPIAKHGQPHRAKTLQTAQTAGRGHEILTLLIAHTAHCGYLKRLEVKLN